MIVHPEPFELFAKNRQTSVKTLSPLCHGMRWRKHGAVL